MRSWIIVGFAALSIGMMAPVGAGAAPATGQTALDWTAAESAPVQDVRYVTRCHRVRVWRDTRYGRRPVLVRRCHRVWR